MDNAIVTCFKDSGVLTISREMESKRLAALTFTCLIRITIITFLSNQLFRTSTSKQNIITNLTFTNVITKIEEYTTILRYTTQLYTYTYRRNKYEISIYFYKRVISIK